jgi:exodeoxyribonuclease VII small subunit
MVENLTYESAYKELNGIAGEIESGNVSVDVLAENVKWASFLIEFCQVKLSGTEDDVNRIIEGMERKG